MVKTVKQGMDWSTKFNKWVPVYVNTPVSSGPIPLYNSDGTQSFKVTDESISVATQMAGRLMRENNMTNIQSKWKCTIVVDEITVPGNTKQDLEKFVKGILPKANVLSCEQIDEHKDLPLVQFGYPEHGNTYNESKLRKVRVTKMDIESIEGFEGTTWKKFLRNKVIGRVEVVEIPAKQ
jgi:hypothetical protein